MVGRNAQFLIISAARAADNSWFEIPPKKEFLLFANSLQTEQALSATAQLRRDITALAQHDLQDTPDRVFDEGLDGAGEEESGRDGDDLVNEGSGEDDAEEAGANEHSANYHWLQEIAAECEEDMNGPLQAVRPIDPVFALDHAALNGFTPDALCLLPIFLWFPSFLPGHPESFHCECGARLIRNGYNENPIGRRVSTLAGQDYFLLTNRYPCPPRRRNDPGCGESYQETDPWIIGQLLKFVQKSFPACLGTRDGLDLSELDIMKVTFAVHFDAEPFSKMARELKVLHHDRLETIYYSAAIHFGFRGLNKIPRFSGFDNPLGYAGYSPSRQYFKSMFTAWFLAHCMLIDRVMSALSGISIKADHKYKGKRIEDEDRAAVLVEIAAENPLAQRNIR
ncbi:hypothetical protein K438DRAFT_1764665 [Mycena galopus ATCC 62051]|nr:hypothetical protein K438DRAFT_1764665 [Mycena galopus ATCC 62051]